MQVSRGYAALLVLSTALLGHGATAQSNDWTGAFAGLELIYNEVTIDPTPGPENSGDGLMIGADLGYRFDLGNFVLGARLSAATGDVVANSNGPDDQAYEFVLRAGIEAGYDLGPVLVYGGFGQTRATVSFAPGDRDREFGQHFTLGADYLLNDQFTLGADVTRTRLNNFSSSDVSVTSFALGAAFRF